MIRTKKIKLLLVLSLVISLLVPYTTPVLAAANDVVKATYTQDDLTKLETRDLATTRHTHGTEYKFTPATGSEKFLHQIVVSVNGKLDWTNTIYCVDAKKGMPQKNGATKYKNLGDFLNSKSSEDLESLINTMGESNYKAIVWIAQNAYLEYEKDEAGTNLDNFLNKVYKQFIDKNNGNIKIDGNNISALDYIKQNIKLDDINMIQQYAIWYFSNPGYLSTTEDTTVTSPYGYDDNKNLVDVKTAYKLGTLSATIPNGDTWEPDPELEDEETAGPRKAAMNMLLSYLITNAKKANVDSSSKSYPVFTETKNNNIKSDIEELNGVANYKFGPFSIDKSESTDYSIKVYDYNNAEKEITNYTLKDSSGKDVESFEKIVSEGIGDFYVYVPTTEEISGINIKITYTNSNTTEVSFWKKDNDSKNEYQPVIWITRTTKAPDVRGVAIGEYDLALRKYIVAVDGHELTGDDSRKPQVDATGLSKGEENAIYVHSKTPVEISETSKITYELRVYNEGTTTAVVKAIQDFIPEGLELAEESKSDWTVIDGIAITEIQNGVLSARDDTVLETKKGTIDGGLSTLSVRIVLQVKEGANVGKALTNIAEIADTNANKDDEDSTPGNFNKGEITDLSTYEGQGNKNGYYPGTEDDDDFDKVIVKANPVKPVVDLALKKFITSVNGEKLTGDASREIKVQSTDPLKSGGHDAKYTSSKSPLKVKKGDIVTYTIRVFNEGKTDAYAIEVADYIPEGLGFINGCSVNKNNEWSLADPTDSVNLKDIENAVENAKKIKNFVSDDLSIENLMVLKGKAEIRSKPLNPKMLEKFDGTSNDLSYTDFEVTCVVLADEVKNDNLKNIAEITINGVTTDGGKTVVTDENESKENKFDIDSTPDNVKTDGKTDEDDDDEEDLIIEQEEKKEYDLALQKYITAVDGTPRTDRKPTITVENGKVKYNHPTEPLALANGQLVEYTIEVFNEGKTEAYAAQVADDLPNGLEFLPDNEINKEYGWKFFDKDGKETTNVSLAQTVRTDYLSLEKGKDNLISGFDASKDKEPASKKLKIVFKVNESVLGKTKETDKRTIINTAEITKETDTDGKDVTDQDSTPDNWKDGEDDLDKEKIYVKYFDLALEKHLVKVIVMENGKTTEYNLNDDTLFKVELNKKRINTTVVKFVYEIKVTNQGEIDGYAKEVKDYIPEGLEFVADDNSGWYNAGTNIVATDALAGTLLTANGGTASVNITLKWINGDNNFNKKINYAEISKDGNEFNSSDVDSTPDNEVLDEDDMDKAEVILGVSTGSNPSYYGLIATVAVIMTTGVILIKKYVL